MLEKITFILTLLQSQIERYSDCYLRFIFAPLEIVFHGHVETLMISFRSRQQSNIASYQPRFPLHLNNTTITSPLYKTFEQIFYRSSKGQRFHINDFACPIHF